MGHKEISLSDEEEPNYMERLSRTIGSNRHSDGLGIMAMGPLVVGRVDEVNGALRAEVLDFVPTLHEAKQLAIYWAGERLDADFDWFCHQCSGSSEWRWSAFINRRLDRLAEVIGSPVMKEAWAEAVASYRTRYPKISDGDWRIFMQGTEEEQQQWREVNLKIARGDSKTAE